MNNGNRNPYDKLLKYLAQIEKVNLTNQSIDRFDDFILTVPPRLIFPLHMQSLKLIN